MRYLTFLLTIFSWKSNNDASKNAIRVFGAEIQASYQNFTEQWVDWAKVESWDKRPPQEAREPWVGQQDPAARRESAETIELEHSVCAKTRYVAK